MSKLNMFNSKNFYGTPNVKMAEKVYSLLQSRNIRCEFESYFKPSHVSTYFSDPFHFYDPRYLYNLPEFHVIRVHRADFHNAKLLIDNDM